MTPRGEQRRGRAQVQRSPEASLSILRRPGPLALAWLVTISIDFLVFGGVLAGILEDGHPAILGETDLFRRIPAGYLSFLAEIGLLAWCIDSSRVYGPWGGARVGGVVGLGFGAALSMGVWSFSSVPVTVLAAWWLTLLLQLTAAGALLGTVGHPRWRTARRLAVGGSIVTVVIGLIAQNLH